MTFLRGDKCSYDVHTITQTSDTWTCSCCRIGKFSPPSVWHHAGSHSSQNKRKGLCHQESYFGDIRCLCYRNSCLRECLDSVHLIPRLNQSLDSHLCFSPVKPLQHPALPTPSQPGLFLVAYYIQLQFRQLRCTCVEQGYSYYYRILNLPLHTPVFLFLLLLDCIDILHHLHGATLLPCGQIGLLIIPVSKQAYQHPCQLVTLPFLQLADLFPNCRSSCLLCITHHHIAEGEGSQNGTPGPADRLVFLRRQYAALQRVWRWTEFTKSW